MHPNSTPDKLPGIDDYQVTIPVTAPNGAASELRFRLPAGNDSMALVLGRHTAMHINQIVQDRHDTDGAGLWSATVVEVTAERIDTPSTDELTAEVDHWKRIVAALGRKLPGVLVVTGDEYEAADPTDLVSTPAGDNAMVFITPRYYAAVAAEAAAQQQPVVLEPDLAAQEEPLLLPAPADVTLPEDPGGPDPDVRGVRVGRLGEFHGGTVEILRDRWWMPVENVTNDGDQIVLTLSTRHTPMAQHGMAPPTEEAVFFDPTAIVTCRPATQLTAGRALKRGATPSILGHQVLHFGQWLTIRETDLNPGTSRITLTLISEAGPATATIDISTKILVRRRRPGAWS